jgi:hypothetical protein
MPKLVIVSLLGNWLIEISLTVGFGVLDEPLKCNVCKTNNTISELI